MNFKKKAFSTKDKSTLIRTFINDPNFGNLSNYPDIVSATDSQLAEMFDYVVVQGKRQWKTGPSNMNSKEWTEEIESRFSYYLSGQNINTTIDTTVDDPTQMIKNVHRQDNILGRNIQGYIGSKPANEQHVGQLAAGFIKFMASRVKDMQKKP